MTGTDTIVSGHSVFTCVCVCVCVCVCACVTHTHTHTYIHIHIYIHAYIHTHKHPHTQTSTNLSINTVNGHNLFTCGILKKKKLKPSTYITPKAPYRGCFERHYLEGTFANVYDPEEHRQRCHQRREKALFRV